MATLEERLKDAEAALASKADKADLEKKADKVGPNTGYKQDKLPKLNPFDSDFWESKEWKAIGLEVFEIIVVTKALTLAKVMLPSFFDSSKLFDTLLEKKLNIKRNEWGFLWKAGVDKTAKAIEELQRKSVATNKRVDRLDRLAADQNRLRRGARGEERRLTGQRRGSSAADTQASRIRDLEARVNSLVRVLG
ncbi:hypothetical protein ACGFW5_25375 [Streptomyces sp. NPDC048416]|uniref:hypothetical protein n=1 Tax=Streptomyces sp. NPDC048416 TaxID=3365546 RepID=UPI0037156992